ncbi:MAG: hypothetical protein DDT38_01023 [Firmicutes bacterium]|nr:hypothetical protein [candidate division NPL-UPA2 bacterium]
MLFPRITLQHLLLATLIAVALGFGIQSYRLEALRADKAAVLAERDRLTEAHNRAVEGLKRAQRTLRTREAEIASQARLLAEAQEGLKSALQAEKEWSDTDVPPAVQDALGGALRGPAGGVRDPSNSPGTAAP